MFTAGSNSSRKTKKHHIKGLGSNLVLQEVLVIPDQPGIEKENLERIALKWGTSASKK
jgi:hypothetical protein